MTRILVVADTPWVRNEVHAALTEPDTTIVDLEDPAAAAPTAISQAIDMVIVDMQVGSMGGMAVARSVREELMLGGHSPIPVVMLLDRAADGFLAGRAGAAAWVVKPFNSQDLLGAFWAAMQRETPSTVDDDAPGPQAPEPVPEPS